MPQATLEPTREKTDTKIVGWEGLLVPYNVPTNEQRQRVVKSPPQLRMRDLPMFVGYQDRTADAHDNAKTGLASITRVWETPDGMWGSGPFDLDDPEAAALARKVSLGFAGWISVDIEPLDVQVSRGPDGREIYSYIDWQISGATLVANAAYNEARIFAISDPSRIVPPSDVLSQQRERYGVGDFARADYRTTNSIMLTFAHDTTHTPAPQTFTLVGDIDLPWAPREREWDGPGAARRVQDWSDGDPDRMSRAFLWRDPDADPTTQAAYSLGFADVIDGELRAVYRGLAAAAGRLNQTSISSEAKSQVQGRIDTLYDKAAAALDDPTINDDQEDEMARDEPEKFQNGEEGDAPQAPAETGNDGLTESQLEAVTEHIRPIIADMIAEALAERDAEEITAADIQAEAESQMARLASIRRLWLFHAPTSKNPCFWTVSNRR